MWSFLCSTTCIGSGVRGSSCVGFDHSACFFFFLHPPSTKWWQSADSLAYNSNVAKTHLYSLSVTRGHVHLLSPRGDFGVTVGSCTVRLVYAAPAACAVVQVNGPGAATRTLSGPLNYHIQTVLAAELVAATHFVHTLAASYGNYWQWYAAGPSVWCTALSRRMANLWRVSWDACKDFGSNTLHMYKVKACVTIVTHIANRVSSGGTVQGINAADAAAVAFSCGSSLVRSG